ncbi:peptidase PmbA [bacterium BMS3Bbin06]|nr:peptidase PmbA [bacterium BMS3Abin08]GBE33735.1 peptidase PmbA [bacterium BMS3Bbin06]HDO36148.1 TldD/PmbA family protein [Nitrospirota bacterium]HDY70580.1 TldD/PmbA family protein [Nitrospirota bacterium]
MKIERELNRKIIETALKRGADQAEVYMISGRSLSIEVKEQTIDALESSQDFGYSLRVLRDGRIGFSFSTKKDEWIDVIENAIEASSFTDPDPLYDLAGPSEIHEIELFDGSVSDISEEVAVEHVRSIEKSALERDLRIKKIRKALGSFSEMHLSLSNSKGLHHSYRSTSVSGQITVVAEDGNDAQMGWGYESSRFLNDVDFRRIGIEAAERALRLLGAEKADTIRGNVLLESPVAAEFLGILASSFSSENVQKGKSLLAGKRGTSVLSEKVNVIDNAILDRRVGSRPFDAEGTPSQKNNLISEGILKGYLYNIYTARRENTVSTGNAVRGGIEGLPSVGISNLYIESASPDDVYDFNDLAGMIDKGLIVTEAMGIHTANPVTGDFSVGVTGLWVENGTVTHPVKESAISGNILDLFGKIVGVSNRLRFYGKIGSPDILIEGIDISG